MESTQNTRFDLVLIGILLLALFGIVIGLFILDNRTGMIAQYSRQLYEWVMNI